MTSSFMSYVDTADFKNLFIEELGWDQPTAKPLTIELEDSSFHVTPVAGFNGLHVWACASLPDRSTQAQIDREVSATSTERLIIFHDGEKQEWRWPRYSKNRGTNMSKLLVHGHVVGHDNSSLTQRLQKIAIDINHEISLVQLLEKMRTAFDVEESEESSKAAKVMAKLYYELEAHLPQDGPAATENLHRISVTMTRILFLVFADDTMMWDEENLFQNFVAFETAKDGSDLATKLEELFTVLNTDKKNRPDLSKGLARFKYVNGGIFSEDIKLPELSIKMRELLLEACRFDWANISPAIFGSMFQAVKSKDLRRELGAHYTSEKDILKTLKPLFLDELHEEFERTKKLKDPTRPLKALRDRLGQIQILDPACGCGNFLIVTYRELRELELQIMESLQEHKGDDGSRTLDATMDLKVSLNQIYGIEIDEWPARIAETALHLIDRQCNLRLIEKFGHAPERLPISEAAAITVDNALSVDWSLVLQPSDGVIIVGNPPFNGARTVSKEQRKDMEAVWGGLINGNFDFVTAWYKKTIDYFGELNGRWAFVSTNSVCQGEPVADLWRPLLASGWRCRFAHRSFQWLSEAAGKAAVHVSVVGFDKLSLPKPTLWTYPENARDDGSAQVVGNINPYLADGPDILVEARREPLNFSLPVAVFGHRPIDGGGLIVEPDELEVIQDDPVAAQYLRKFLGATELLNDKLRWCLWLRDANPDDFRSSPVLRERLESVRVFRTESKNPTTKKAAANPHLFGIYASEQKFDPSVSFLAIPSVVSQARPYFTARHCDSDTVSSNLNYIANDPDGFLLGILSSSMFITWMRAVGGRLKSDLRFTNTYSYNTFPLPKVSDAHRAEIVEAAKQVMEARAQHQESSLADLYDPLRMPLDLVKAHLAIDRVIDKVFGARGVVDSDAERRKILFRSYSKLTTENTLI